MAFVSTNPATDAQFASYPSISGEEALVLVARQRACFETWRRTSLAERSALLIRLAAIVRAHAQEAARMLALEMGKPLTEGLAELEKCAACCEYFAEKGPVFLSQQAVPTEASTSYVLFEPLGTILAIMPWNYPFWQVFRFAAPALLAGNTALLKHASNVTGCAKLIEAWFVEAGFPPDAFRLLVAELELVAEVIALPEIKAVTLTGSTRAGRAVAELAGRHLKKVVLELGGSDPYLILEDADLERAAKACVTSRLLNCGQSCIAAKRFIVCEQVEPEFTARVLALMQQKTFGDPLGGVFDLGPMARKDLRDALHGQVEASIRAGAKLLLGGQIPAGPGCFYPPTLLHQVPLQSPAFQEELFGPVASIFSVKDEDEAIQRANESAYGLGAAIFTKDLAKGERLAGQEVQAGACFVNNFVRSDPRLPFGGINESGYGRELSIFGIREFVNIKTIWVN